MQPDVQRRGIGPASLPVAFHLRPPLLAFQPQPTVAAELPGRGLSRLANWPVSLGVYVGAIGGEFHNLVVYEIVPVHRRPLRNSRSRPRAIISTGRDSGRGESGAMPSLALATN